MRLAVDLGCSGTLTPLQLCALLQHDDRPLRLEDPTFSPHAVGPQTGTELSNLSRSIEHLQAVQLHRTDSLPPPAVLDKLPVGAQAMDHGKSQCTCSRHLPTD